MKCLCWVGVSVTDGGRSRYGSNKYLGSAEGDVHEQAGFHNFFDTE